MGQTSKAKKEERTKEKGKMTQKKFVLNLNFDRSREASSTRCDAIKESYAIKLYRFLNRADRDERRCDSGGSFDVCFLMRDSNFWQDSEPDRKSA